MSHLPRSVSKWEGRCPICRAACQSGRAGVPTRRAPPRVKAGRADVPSAAFAPLYSDATPIASPRLPPWF